MSWLNITRNIEDYSEEAIGWLKTQNNLWVVTTSGSAARLRKAELAQGGSAPVWGTSYTGLPGIVSLYEYAITGFAEDTENNRLYIANSSTGQIFYNITGDPRDDWGVILSTQYGEYTDANAHIKELIFYNNQVFIAHKGGVSVLDYSGDSSTWQIAGDFTGGFEGVGQCTGFHILNNELHVTVAFGDLGVVYKYNADTLSLKWDKVAELSATSTHPEYLTARNNVLFCTDNSAGQNIFNSEGIDTTLTGQPRFTQSNHLEGVPSSMLTHSADNFVYTTCWNDGFSEESDAYSDNLVTSVRQLVPYSVEPGETFISAVTGTSLSDYTSYTIKNGGDWFSSTSSTNPDLAIEFAIQTNGLEFLPGETYTIVWEYGFMCNAGTEETESSVTGSGPLKAGFKSNVGTGLDGNSPGATYVNNSGTLFTLDTATGVKRHTFTFQADDIAPTTNGEFRIEGTVAAAVKYAQRSLETWHFSANALIRNLKVYRGDAELANSQFINIEYTVKAHSSIPTIERENHSIGDPSPPDQWFVKFPAAGIGLSVDPNIPPSVGIPPGGGDSFNWPPTPPPISPVDSNDPEPPPPYDPNNADGGDSVVIDDVVNDNFAT